MHTQFTGVLALQRRLETNRLAAKRAYYRRQGKANAMKEENDLLRLLVERYGKCGPNLCTAHSKRRARYLTPDISLRLRLTLRGGIYLLQRWRLQQRAWTQTVSPVTYRGRRGQANMRNRGSSCFNKAYRCPLLGGARLHTISTWRHRSYCSSRS